MNPTLVVAAVAAIFALYALRSRAASMAAWRRAMLARADQHVKAATPYQWGGGHTGVQSWGLDCSGLVIDCAAAAGFRIEMNSNAMWRSLSQVAQPEPGDLALFGNSVKAVHVMIVERWYPSEGRAACIGAQNGDSDVTSPEVAAERGALVKRVADHRTDSRFLGFVTLVDVAEGRRSGISGFSNFG